MLAPRSSLELNSPFLTDGNVRSLQGPALPNTVTEFQLWVWTFGLFQDRCACGWRQIASLVYTDFSFINIKFKGNFFFLHINILFVLFFLNSIFRFLFFASHK